MYVTTRMVLSGYATAILKRYVWIQYRYYTKMTSLLVPRESVRGMTHLDRIAFTTTVELPFFKFHGIQLSKLMPVLKKYLFKTRNFKPVQNVNDETLIYLNPTMIKCYDNFLDNEKKQLSGMYEHFGIKQVTMDYDNWQSYDLLRAVLPEEVEVPTSYSLVGHIVHLNLRDMQLPYRSIIGQVYLDTIPNARTVVNKINAIDTPFRNFTMEILAGDRNTIARVKENGFTYELDFSHVYWNPRLGTEHMNVVTFMKPNDVLYDVFAGIGPFAIPAAKKGVKVFANDLNPESYKWLQKNIINNKVQKSVQSFNMDGREFLRTVFKNDILNRRASNDDGMEHIVMNLPALAVEFLDVFFDSFDENEIKQICSRPPTVYLYCFVKAEKGEDACKLGQVLVEQKLGCTFSINSLVDVQYVRNVALNKEMIRVSFLLNEDILKGEEPATKKLKIETSFDVAVNDNIAENNGKEQRITDKEQEEKCI